MRRFKTVTSGPVLLGCLLVVVSAPPAAASKFLGEKREHGYMAPADAPFYGKVTIRGHHQTLQLYQTHDREPVLRVTLRKQRGSLLAALKSIKTRQPWRLATGKLEIHGQKVPCELREDRSRLEVLFDLPEMPQRAVLDKETQMVTLTAGDNLPWYLTYLPHQGGESEVELLTTLSLYWLKRQPTAHALAVEASQSCATFH